MVIYQPSCQLAFTRLRDKEWTNIDRSGDGRFKFFEDVAQIKDKMYAVTHSWSLLFAFEYTNQCTSYLNTIAQGYKTEEFMKTYLVGSNEKQLLLVRRYMNYEICGCVTERFRVFELNSDKHEWIEKNDLGDVALFVVDNSSISMATSNVLGSESNCIYFYHGCDYKGRRASFQDFRVYDIKSQRISKLAQTIRRWSYLQFDFCHLFIYNKKIVTAWSRIFIFIF